MDNGRGVVDTMTVMQRGFFLDYLRHGNATKAVRDNGYAHPDKAGPRLAKSDKIQWAIQDFYRQQHMDAVELIGRMSQQARADYARYFEWDEEKGCLVVDLEQMLADGKGHLIQDVDWKNVGGVAVQTVKFQPVFDSQMAIARHLGLFRDGVDVRVSEPIMFIEPVVPTDVGIGEAPASPAGGEEGDRDE